MPINLSVRSYVATTHRHKHKYHQLVFVLAGTADNYTDLGDGLIGPGQCIVHPAGCSHVFMPNAESRFLVMDTDDLPSSMNNLSHSIITVPKQVLSFCYFVEEQLKSQVSTKLEQSIGELFAQLLEEQNFLPRMDDRIVKVVNYLQQDLSQTPSLVDLSEEACLSLSQLKNLFKKETGLSPLQYLMNLRMEKARALLAHTDVPVNLVANQVGYGDVSAFSRRFSSHYGFTPKQSRSQ